MPATKTSVRVSDDQINEMLDKLDVDEFWREGFAIIPDVYSDEEVATMRAQVSAHCGAGGGELVMSDLRHVLTDGRMAAVARKLLGTDDIIYGGDSSATINGKIRAWHKDNTDREDPDAPDWDDRYTQLRFGIYLQDHKEHTGGLNLKPGAHDVCDLSTGKTLYCRNSPNDLLVWSMRMTHSGAGTLLKDPSKPDPEPEQWNAFPDDQVAPAHDERMAVFAHIGANDKHATRYLDYLKTRTYIVGFWRRKPFTPDAIAEMEAAGFTVRDLPSEVADDKRAGLDAVWQPFPYPGMKRPEPEVKVVYRDRAVPAAAGGGTAARQVQPPFAQRYGRAIQRRLRGVAKGARKGWYDAAPKSGRR